MQNRLKFGLQASVGVALAILIAHFTPTTKSYWAPATVLVLLAGSQGESNSRAVSRVVMTILGGIASTAIVYFFHMNVLTIFIIFVGLTYIMYYLLNKSYSIIIFVAIFWVVFVYALMGAWNEELLFWRVMETMIGAFIVLGVTSLWRVRIQDRVHSTIQGYMVDIRKGFELLRESTENQNSVSLGISYHSKIEKEYSLCVYTIKVEKYERSWNKSKNRLARELIVLFENLSIEIEKVYLIRIKNNCNRDFFSFYLRYLSFLCGSIEKLKQNDQEARCIKGKLENARQQASMMAFYTTKGEFYYVDEQCNKLEKLLSEIYDKVQSFVNE